MVPKWYCLASEWEETVEFHVLYFDLRSIYFIFKCCSIELIDCEYKLLFTQPNKLQELC